MAAGEQVHAAAAGEAERRDPVAGAAPSTRPRPAMRGHVDLEREVADVHQDDAVGEQRQVGGGEDARGRRWR